MPFEPLYRRKPNFFIVGTVRGGTTWLHAQLGAHPQVFMCQPKEPHFYSGVSHRRGSRHVPVVQARADYLRLFDAAADEIAVGDASTSYLWSERAPERIFRDNPDARIIAVLRDPVDRAFSHYLKDVREGVQTRPFFEAVRTDWRAPSKTWEEADLYIDLGMYHRQVQRYLDIFGPGQVLILSFAEIHAAADAVRTKVADFLGIHPALFPPPSGPENAYARPANAVARHLLGNERLRLAVRVLPYSWRRTVKNKVLLRRDHKPVLDRASVEFLALLFEDDLAALRRLLGRPLPELSRHLRILERRAVHG